METLPSSALIGPNGDGPKVLCASCHQGAHKPLLDQCLTADFPSLLTSAESKP